MKITTKLVTTSLIFLFGILFFSSCFDVGVDPAVDFNLRWKNDTTSIGLYLKSKNLVAKPDVNGIRFIILQIGSGLPPNADNEVEFNYTGRLLDESIFDSGNINGLVTNFIPGLQAGLQLLPEGTSAILYIPSVYAYGINGAGTIPPNASLIFEVVLNKIVKTTTEKEQLKSDTLAIDTYLTNNAINAIHHKSGLRYVITQTGTGVKPTWYSRVTIAYTGKLLSTDEIIVTETNQPSSTFDSWVVNYFGAFEVGLQQLPMGSKATLYIPSGLGFGARSTSTGKATVPSNSNLIYDIELIDVKD